MTFIILARFALPDPSAPWQLLQVLSNTGLPAPAFPFSWARALPPVATIPNNAMMNIVFKLDLLSKDACGALALPNPGTVLLLWILITTILPRKSYIGHFGHKTTAAMWSGPYHPVNPRRPTAGTSVVLREPASLQSLATTQTTVSETVASFGTQVAVDPSAFDRVDTTLESECFAKRPGGYFIENVYRRLRRHCQHLCAWPCRDGQRLRIASSRRGISVDPACGPTGRGGIPLGRTRGPAVFFERRRRAAFSRNITPGDFRQPNRQTCIRHCPRNPRSVDAAAVLLHVQPRWTPKPS